MYRIEKHPIIDISPSKNHSFLYEGKQITGKKGFTIAAALHQAGYPVHSHSLRNRERSLECGIGKCGACEMLVDGQIKRICITLIDNIKEVSEIPKDYTPQISDYKRSKSVSIYKTDVVIVGAGPAGLACREELSKHGIDNIVIDNNDKIGGQFTMQTHQFFFFEKEKKFGGMRGFDIAKTLAGDNHDGIFLNSTVWDLLQGKRVAVKNIITEEIYFVDTGYFVVATGAVPFMPTFGNDDLPGVYTAAVVQKMMNNELTLLGKNVLTVGAGNIGYLTSYQLLQAGAKVKAIIEAMPYEGGFPVQANRIRRLGIPILTSQILIEAIPNNTRTGITGAIVAESKNFKAIPGTEKAIDGIDAINICTGLVPDDQLLIKGNEVFGRNCFGAGDAIRIGEGTSAVLKGKQLAYEILHEMGENYSYDNFLATSKEYIDSQQHPIKVIEKPYLPDDNRIKQKPFVIIDCIYGFACNPCVFACKHDAIKKSSTATIPRIDYNKCIGCMDCVYQCPGLAIFGYNIEKNWLFLPVEFNIPEKSEVFLVNNNGDKIGTGIIEKILKKPNKTDIVRVRSIDIRGKELLNVRGFIIKEDYPQPFLMGNAKMKTSSETYICHCDDVTLDEILNTIGERSFISVDEIKHTTRLGMGACRGKRCIKRLKQTLHGTGISIVGDATPRGPLSNQVRLGELYPEKKLDNIIITNRKNPHEIIEMPVIIAGGGIGGSALFRYLAEENMKPLMINFGRGASWRNIAGGRTAFSLPEIADIAEKNLQIFKNLQQIKDINLHLTKYITFCHNDEMVRSCEASTAWSDAVMIEPREFRQQISPYFNSNTNKYLAALVTNNCWQASPGKVVDLLRRIGIKKGGTILEDCKLVDVYKQKNTYHVLIRDHTKKYIEYRTEVFINALGAEGNEFAEKLGIETGLFPVKHQAFITRRLPMMGHNNTPLNMLIDRRDHKGFSAVYGQQLAETGQIIGCASPSVEAKETSSNLKINSREFLNIASELFVDWIPELSSVGFQAVWAGYYVEPKMIIDNELGLFLGLRGQGFMLGQYLAKLYVDRLKGRKVPDYFDRLKLGSDALAEKMFK